MSAGGRFSGLNMKLTFSSSSNRSLTSRMSVCLPLVFIACALTIGCRNDSKSSTSTQDWESQMKQSQAQLDLAEKQAKRTDEQQAKAEEQQKRMDKILDKWEEQGRRLDAVLEKLEKTSVTNK